MAIRTSGVEDRDVEQPAQAALDLEAARSADVLQVDAAETGGYQLDRSDYFFCVLTVQADRPGVDVGELLEQSGLALHDRQGGVRADVAQAEHGRAVGDHGHRVPLDGQAAGVFPVPGDRQRDPAHARGVGHGQVVPVPQRHLGAHLDLPAQVQQEGAVADLVHGHAVDAAQRGHQGLGVLGAARGAGDVDPQPVVAPGGHVQGGHHAAGLLHRPGDLADGAAPAGHLEPDGDRVGHAWRHRHVGSRLSAGLQGTADTA
jgi:hypothetical protein